MFIPLLITICFAKDLTIYPTVNELCIYDLKDIFGSINNPSYELTPMDSPFIIVDSIQLIGATNHTMNDQPKSIVSNSRFTQFAVIDKQNTVYWTKQTLPVDTPQFLGKYKLNETCYSLEYIDDTTLIIDCMDSRQYNLFNFLQVGVSTKQSKLLDKNSINQSSITFRKMNILDDYCVLIGQSSVDLSIIDVYDLNVLNNTGNTLNTTVINKLAQIKDRTYQFKLIDFIAKFGLVYVLDETRLLILQYKDEWKLNLQIILPSKGVAFDVNIVSDLNGNEKFELVILTQNGKLYYYNDFVSTPTEMNIVGQSVQISNQYIIVQQDQNLLQINLDDKNIVKSKLWNNNYFIVSSQYSTLIEVGTTFTNRYILSNGYLQGQSKSQTNIQQQIILKATYIDIQHLQQQEVSKIIYQFLDIKDQNLYEISTPTLFKNAIQGNLYYEYLDPFLSGPNQKYQQESSQTDIILNFYKQIEQTHLIIPTDIVFQDTIATDQHLSIMVFQSKNLTIQLWGCSFYVPKSECLPLSIELKNDVQLTKNTFTGWIYDNDLYFAFTSKPNEIQIWEISQEKINHIQTIKNKGQTVTQLLGSNKNLFILLSNGDIDIYEFGLLVDKITPPEPAMQIFNNPYHSSQILIVKTISTIIIYRFNFVVEEIEYFMNYDSKVYISIYDQSFIVVNSSTIIEYFMSPQQNRIAKTLPLYEYKIVNPIYAVQSKHNGLLFIPCESDNKISFLVYQPQQQAHDSLIQVINTFIAGDLKNIIMSVDGFQISLFFYQYLKQNHLYQILQNTQATSLLKSTDQYKDYCQTVEQPFSVSNPFNQMDFTTQITVINRMEVITIVDTSLQEMVLGEQNQTNYLSLGGDWYKGQVVDIKVLCKQCPQEIVLNQPIYPITYNFLSNARIITKFDDDHQVVINKNTLIILDQNLKSTMEQYLQQEFYSIAIHPQQNYMILAGKNDKITNLQMITCKSPYSCSQLQSKTIQVSNIGQMYILQEDFLILSTPQEIVVYHITYTQNSWTLELKFSTNIESYSTCKGINYFFVSKIYTDNKPEYAITLLDSTNQILFLFYKIKNGSLSLISSQFRNIQNEIINHNQYAQQDTKYIQILSYTQIEKTVTQYILFKMIVMTNNVASYGMQFQFDFNYEYHSSQILFIINQYADWTTLAAGSIQTNKLCIPYSNGIKTVMLFYNIPINTQKITSPPTITSISGIRDDVLPIDIPPVVYVLHSEKQSYYLLTNLVRYKERICVNLYALYDQPILAVSNTVELDLKQQLTIFLTNDFSNASRQVTLKSLYEPIQQNASVGWIVAVIVIASLLAVGMLFFVMRRRSIRLSYQNYYPMQDQQLRNM
ncbi:unnamed protein product [Paramecium primaurelia]|uniref:Transmembrane protein n=1 Tax=Paramecium primaurelia TaxID=5886 RepID=A0A8S1Q7C5_PARPR|nr:unnamed protein product [Paramecium primaurelia]